MTPLLIKIQRLSLFNDIFDENLTSNFDRGQVLKLRNGPWDCFSTGSQFNFSPALPPSTFDIFSVCYCIYFHMSTTKFSGRILSEFSSFRRFFSMDPLGVFVMVLEPPTYYCPFTPSPPPFWNFWICLFCFNVWRKIDDSTCVKKKKIRIRLCMLNRMYIMCVMHNPSLYTDTQKKSNLQFSLILLLFRWNISLDAYNW